jgi:PAS domain-containing protein
VWVNSTLSLFRDESGEPEWWVSVVEDISDREQVEAKLQESEQRFRGLMEQAPMAISLFTPDGKLAQVNPAWKRSWGESSLR